LAPIQDNFTPRNDINVKNSINLIEMMNNLVLIKTV